MLGLGRALRNVMAVIFIIGNTHQLADSAAVYAGHRYHFRAGERS